MVPDFYDAVDPASYEAIIVDSETPDTRAIGTVIRLSIPVLGPSLDGFIGGAGNEVILQIGKGVNGPLVPDYSFFAHPVPRSPHLNRVINRT